MSDSSQVDRRREHAAKNESVFREVNEHVEASAAGTFHLFVCECQDRNCSERVPMTLQEYEAVRADSNSFLIVPGHEVELVDEVTDRAERYFVVRKIGAGAVIAEHLDPRARWADDC